MAVVARELSFILSMSPRCESGRYPLNIITFSKTILGLDAKNTDTIAAPCEYPNRP
jgi:hypothetical protein